MPSPTPTGIPTSTYETTRRQNADALTSIVQGAFLTLPSRARKLSEVKGDSGTWNIVLRKGERHSAVVGVYASCIPGVLGNVVVVDNTGRVRSQTSLDVSAPTGETLAFLLLSALTVCK